MSQKQHQDIASLPSVDSADAPPDLYVEIIDHLRFFPAKLGKKCQTAKLFNKKTENIYVGDGMVKGKDYFLERKKWSGGLTKALKFIIFAQFSVIIRFQRVATHECANNI